MSPAGALGMAGVRMPLTVLRARSLRRFNKFPIIIGRPPCRQGRSGTEPRPPDHTGPGETIVPPLGPRGWRRNATTWTTGHVNGVYVPSRSALAVRRRESLVFPKPKRWLELADHSTRSCRSSWVDPGGAGPGLCRRQRRPLVRPAVVRSCARPAGTQAADGSAGRWRVESRSSRPELRGFRRTRRATAQPIMPGSRLRPGLAGRGRGRGLDP